jgi:hypothetical protein
MAGVVYIGYNPRLWLPEAASEAENQDLPKIIQILIAMIPKGII